MKQIALWKTKDGKRWLRLFEDREGWWYEYTNGEEYGGGRYIDCTSAVKALLYVKKNVLDFWPSKPIRYH